MQILYAGRGSYWEWSSEPGRLTHQLGGVWSLEQACPVSLYQSVRVPAAFGGHIQIWIIQRESIRRVSRESTLSWGRALSEVGAPGKGSERDLANRKFSGAYTQELCLLRRGRSGSGPGRCWIAKKCHLKSHLTQRLGRAFPDVPLDWCKEAGLLPSSHTGCRRPLRVERDLQTARPVALFVVALA